jgi:hypothetical protein
MALRILRRILIVVLASLVLPTVTQAQAPPSRTEEPAPSREDRRRDEDRRQQWRERREKMASATAEERREMRLDWRVSMLTRTYELSEKQQGEVRAELRRMDDERRESVGPDAEKLDRVREEMREYWRKRMAGDDNDGRRAWRSMMDDEEFTKLRDQMRSLRERTSIDWQENNERIEKLLPAEQVEAGRKRRAEMMTRWTERRENAEGRSRWSDGDSRGERDERWRERRRQREARVTPPVDSWDEFTRNFIEKYKFDSAQSSTAGAILKDVKGQATTLQRKQQDARTSLETVEDRADKARQAAELDEPINVLFTELKTRLERLVTERQRRQAGEA